MATYQKYKSLIVLSAIFFLSSLACQKQDTSAVPYVPVSILINIQNSDYSALKTVGGYVYVTGGSKGIIVYRSDLNTFKAYDRHCPYQPKNSCSFLKVDVDAMTTIDTCCTSKFVLQDNSIFSGPSSLKMQEYATSFDGNIVSINN